MIICWTARWWRCPCLSICLCVCLLPLVERGDSHNIYSGLARSGWPCTSCCCSWGGDLLVLNTNHIILPVYRWRPWCPGPLSGNWQVRLGYLHVCLFFYLHVCMYVCMYLYYHKVVSYGRLSTSIKKPSTSNNNKFYIHTCVSIKEWLSRVSACLLSVSSSWEPNPNPKQWVGR